MKATWSGSVIAESDDTVLVEDNHYFPAYTVKKEFLRDSSAHTTCPWKGVASYFDVVVGENANPGAAWYYPAPKEAARRIAGRIAFWKGVEITD